MDMFCHIYVKYLPFLCVMHPYCVSCKHIDPELFQKASDPCQIIVFAVENLKGREYSGVWGYKNW